MSIRAELQAACVGLKADVDAALTAAGLDTLKSMAAPDDEETGRLRLPRIVVRLDGARIRTAYQNGRTPAVEETLTVTFDLQLDGTESEAIAYEDVLVPIIRSAWQDLDDGLSSGRLGAWYPSGGDLSQDPDGDDDTQRLVSMQFDAMVEW